MKRAIITVNRPCSPERLARLREAMPDYEVVLAPRGSLLDLVLVWFFTFGVWPASHPDHNFSTVAGAIDLTLHGAAFVWLWFRWKIERRTP